MYDKFMKMMLIAVVVFGFSCADDTLVLTLNVTNPSSFDRTDIIEIPYDTLRSYLLEGQEASLQVFAIGSETPLRSQKLDENGDGSWDVLLFQGNVAAGASRQFVIRKGVEYVDADSVRAYSRFVPERTDDYTWENDKVAFRTYGPVAQKMVEDQVPGGTLSSGMDLWLKRVPYAVIESWYKGYKTDPMYYHTDRGEGYDPYHVGSSRGTGGIGVWDDENQVLITSKNFISYRTLADGPLRVVFELDYALWSPYNIIETKRITLDLGSHFYKADITLTSDEPVPNYTVGITLHENEGEIALDSVAGIFSHWEPIQDSYVGEAIIIDPAKVLKANVHVSEEKDKSQLLIQTPGNTRLLSYYAGFAWTKSGAVDNFEDWKSLAKKEAERIRKPLQLSFSKVK